MVITAAKKACGRDMRAKKPSKKKSSPFKESSRPLAPIEIRRMENIKRNNKILRSLGLVNGDLSSSDEDEDEDDLVSLERGDLSLSKDKEDDLVSLEKGTNRSVVEEEQYDPTGDDILEILDRKKDKDGATLLVLWDNGIKTWEPGTLVKIDYPHMVELFVDQGRTDKTAPTCSNTHSLSSHFQMEVDPRYWNEGQSFHNVTCLRCENDCRPSLKQPTYRCSQWNTKGCKALMCSSCFVAIITVESELLGGRRSSTRK